MRRDDGAVLNAAKREIPYVNLAAQYAEEREELLPIIDRALAGGQFVGGEPIEALEQALQPVCGAEHVVALNSGTDALILGMAALGIGPGDEVITPPNSFVASTERSLRSARSRSSSMCLTIRILIPKKSKRLSPPVPRPSCRCI